ncbi:hypothetical protein AVEN_164461-1 [Araneus ventricosus]|uniref:Uncharacterized protein n=1 Tax=Araneus ventricosus TaxID=182803 RepID=A0A4Y2QBF8_ARAVE|nr:hypothetical protein AVEN_164461-1 [Araneus ventricosus]
MLKYCLELLSNSEFFWTTPNRGRRAEATVATNGKTAFANPWMTNGESHKWWAGLGQPVPSQLRGLNLLLPFLLSRILSIQRESIVIVQKFELEILTNLHVLDLPESEKHNFGIMSVFEHDNSKTIIATGMKFVLLHDGELPYELLEDAGESPDRDAQPAADESADVAEELPVLKRTTIRFAVTFTKNT